MAKTILQDQKLDIAQPHVDEAKKSTRVEVKGRLRTDGDTQKAPVHLPPWLSYVIIVRWDFIAVCHHAKNYSLLVSMHSASPSRPVISPGGLKDPGSPW